MNITITDEVKSLQGKEFVLYCLYDHPDKEFREKTSTLSYALVHDLEKTENYIRRLIAEPDKSLIYYYPAFDDEDKIKGKEHVGTILDGCLYFG